MKVVLVMFRDGRRKEFPITREKTVIGRRQDCDLRIPTSDVSRRHCEIDIRGEEIVVRDLGSSNGTFVNGRRVAEAELEPGDRITVGPVSFVVQIDGQPADIRPEAPAPAPAERRPEKPAAPASARPAPPEEAVEEILELGEEELDLSQFELIEDDEGDEDEPTRKPGK